MNKMQVTLKLRVHGTDETIGILHRTLAEYTSSFNRVCAKGWQKKRVNGIELHHDTYAAERANTLLPSQLVCSARVKATEALLGTKTRERKGKKVSCPVSRHCSIRYDIRSANIKLGQKAATLASISGRQAVVLSVPPCHETRIGWKVCSSDLCSDRKHRLWLHVVVESELPPFQSNGKVVGIDLGVNRPAVTSTDKFLGSRQWKVIENRAFRLRRSLQAKGSKSAKRHLKRLSGRLGRFRRDCDHVLSKHIVGSVERGTTLALEDLTHIRTRVKVRKAQRRRLHSWSFNRLQSFIEYKARLAGDEVAYGDPRYTSQKCSRCGSTDKRSRKTQSRFVCSDCGFSLDADLNAARNIASNHLAAQATRLPGGLPVNQPIVADSVSCRKLPASAGSR